ncbi:methylenetetrahydrofolate reductase (NADPH) [Aequitasia blattaphilus]|uniref:Methylenetetrahydrofolate reductase n=1 Tax=Aequitasia blattaphilus TaxID=2949332 RepID=A0ABT1E6N1_9FIRM|nr:methylenetetrahydrofolate reductase [NAD(P)H] [Aequitasia blattaphilus]MCP1101495.1 methylenetetrahydrofolate reductase [NAD(P)H] [Aequitasia blattaphilus]MCR8614135.1 methylenetetrahydrofolate reductase [NAD(P)H] [Aequitasia blattaphilus]
MKINKILEKKKTVSFEIFPPKNKEGDISSIYSTVEKLKDLNPDFISVTYGSGGSTIGKTIEIADVIKNEYKIESVAHFTGVVSTKKDANDFCQKLKECNVENILALRGDKPQDASIVCSNDFQYSNDLVAHIQRNFPEDFSIAGACYPEVHQEADCMENDLKALKAKVDAGATFLITQIFYDNNYYYHLVREARKIGINVPILAGIMPALNAKQLLRTTKLCGCTVPYDLITKIERYYNNDAAMQEVGINYAVHQMIDLIANDVDGLHIYTMNRPEIAKNIFAQIPNILKDL